MNLTLQETKYLQRSYLNHVRRSNTKMSWQGKEREDGKQKKVTVDFEPFKPINALLYLYDNKFHTKALNELLEFDVKFGLIVIDGNDTLFGTLGRNLLLIY